MKRLHICKEFSRFDFYRVDFELSDDTMFDMIDPVFLLKKLLLSDLCSYVSGHGLTPLTSNNS